MNLTIISGLSGSGKSVALRALEDMNYYCIDNLPVSLLEAFASDIQSHTSSGADNVAVGIDARNRPGQLNSFPDITRNLKARGISCKILFLQADDATLLKRFSETRRKHPLTGERTPLADAIADERRLLMPISSNADMFIDTSRTNVHQLRDLVMEYHGKTDSKGVSLLLRSFGYKHGVPADADFVFDARCLPNPHWQPDLRSLTGRDREVISFLESNADVRRYFEDVARFLGDWIPCFEADNRSYLSIAIGCTGGQHRSVYLVEKMATQLKDLPVRIMIRHRELD